MTRPCQRGEGREHTSPAGPHTVPDVPMLPATVPPVLLPTPRQGAHPHSPPTVTPRPPWPPHPLPWTLTPTTRRSCSRVGSSTRTSLSCALMSLSLAVLRTGSPPSPAAGERAGQGHRRGRAGQPQPLRPGGTGPPPVSRPGRGHPAVWASRAPGPSLGSRLGKQQEEAGARPHAGARSRRRTAGTRAAVECVRPPGRRRLPRSLGLPGLRHAAPTHIPSGRAPRGPRTLRAGTRPRLPGAGPRKAPEWWGPQPWAPCSLPLRPRGRRDKS